LTAALHLKIAHFFFFPSGAEPGDGSTVALNLLFDRRPCVTSARELLPRLKAFPQEEWLKRGTLSSGVKT
jgi:hypothetical protein